MWLLAYAALLLGLTLAFQQLSPHPTARLATIDSLVERGTFAINGSPFEDTIDKVYIDGRYYSAQPPATAVVGALVYYPLHWLGMRVGTNERVTYALLTFLSNGLATLTALVLFSRALKWTSLPEQLHLPLTASLACATLLLPFSTTLNSHGFCAALITFGLYWYLLGQETERSAGAIFGSGMAFSLCAAADHAMLVFYGLFAACILLRPGQRGRVFWFLLPAIFTLGPTCAYYYLIGHSIRPFATRAEFYVYPGSPWLATGVSTMRLTGTSWNSLSFAVRYGPLMLVGRRGFLIYNPLAWLALYGLARSIWTRAIYYREATAVLAGSVAVNTYYAFSSANFSGASYSIRWFVPFLPLWWFFGSSAIEKFQNWTPTKKWLLAGLCALSVVYALAGALNQWPEEWHGYRMPLDNIKYQLFGLY